MRLAAFVLVGLLLLFAINQKNTDLVDQVNIDIEPLEEGEQLIDKNEQT